MILLTSKLKSVNTNIINSNISAVKSSFNVFMNDIFIINVVSESVNYESKNNDDVNMLTDNKKHNKNENINL